MKSAGYAMFARHMDRHHGEPEARWLGPGAITVAIIVIVLAAAWHASSLIFAPPTDQSLVEAAAVGDYDGVARALRAGVCVDGVGLARGGPLLLACAQGDTRVVELLLRNGADASCTTAAGYTPLMTAAIEGNTTIIALLLDAGADPNQPTPSATTALGAAAGTGNEAAIDLLLAHGAEPSALLPGSNVFHDPPLMCAIRACESASIVARLIEAGADVNVVDNEGITPLRAALDEGRDDLVRLLLRHGARHPPLKLALAKPLTSPAT